MNRYYSVTLAKAALGVALFSTQLFSQSICDGVAGNLVANCGFETGNYSGWTLSGNTAITGVSTTNPNSGIYSHRSGAQFTPSILTQLVPTVAGGVYTFSFYQRMNSLGGPGRFEAFFNGVSVFAETTTNHAYIQRSFTVTATSASTPIRFEIREDDNLLVAQDNLDDVALVGSDLTVTKTHAGNFSQGQLGATYTITPRNSGGAATSGTTTVVDTLPAGLTATAISGSGWTCTLATLTCTTTAVVAANTNFNPITVTVNVAPNATNVTNNVAVSGGGQTNTTNDTAADPTIITVVDFFQIRYAANLTSGDGVINITNSGANGASLNGPGFGGAAGNICVNVYAFSPDEQLVSCCSCLITPNGLVSLSVNTDLISNTLTGVRPNSVVVKLVNTGAGGTFTGTTCTNSAALAGQAAFPLFGGFQAWGTSAHAGAAAGSLATTETPFSKATLSPAELASITNRCTNIIGNGSTFGICRSCRAGGLNQIN